MAVYSRTEDFATLSLTASVQHIAPGESFKLFVASALKSGAGRYSPEVTYRLFVRLPEGLTVQSVSETPNKVHLNDKRAEWTGGPGVSPEISVSWDGGESEREKYFWNRWLLATWTSSQVPDTSVDTPVGWTIEIQVDASHSFAAVGNIAFMDATLMAMQSNVLKEPERKPLTLYITPVEPLLAAVTLPDSPLVNGNSVVRAGATSVRVRAILAKTTAVAKMQVRWQVKGALAQWNQADDVAVTGGNRLEFLVHYDFSQPVTLRFSYAEPGGSDWGTPFDVPISVVTDLLVLENPLIRLDAGQIILSCAVREPSAEVKFARLELSVDGGAHWQDISDKKAGSSSPLVFRDDITGTTSKERDFSQGVYLRATDNLQRVTPYQPVHFDAATFLSATWSGASTVLNDVNSGEALNYTIHLHCTSGVVLPPATLYLRLPDAVEADASARSWYWMLDETSGEPKNVSFDAPDWRGNAQASAIYRGPIQTGMINAAAHVRSDEALLHKTLPPATLSVYGNDFIFYQFTSVEPVRAQVYRPAPTFQIVNPVLHTNRNAVIIRGIFTPSLEPAADLVFTVSVDNGAEHGVTPTIVNSNFFELKLDPAVFTLFSHNGEHSVQLAVRRRADTRANERSSHHETLRFTIDNQAPVFRDTLVAEENGNLTVTGEVFSPAGATAPVTQAFVYWDGAAEQQDRLPMKLTPLDGTPPGWSFSNVLPVSSFSGSLYPRIEAFTEAGVPVSQNLLFSTAKNLLRIALKINGNTVSEDDAPSVPKGEVNFTITVTSLVGLPQKMNMYMTLGKAFSASKHHVVITQPAAGKGTVHETEPAGSWNGISSSQLLQAEGLTQGATFSVSGTTELKKLEEELPDAGMLTLSFTETDPYTKRTISPTDKDDGVIFTAYLRAQP